MLVNHIPRHRNTCVEIRGGSRPLVDDQFKALAHVERRRLLVALLRDDPQSEFPDDSDDEDRVQEVWSLTGHEGIQSRTFDLLREAESEIVLVVVEEEVLTDALFDQLRAAVDRGVNIVVGGITTDIVTRIESEIPSVEAFETEIGWLMGPGSEDEVAISRLLLTDRTTLLVSSFYPDEDYEGEGLSEQAIFATGLGNGVVVLIRRLLSTGLGPTADPGQ